MFQKGLMAGIMALLLGLSTLAWAENVYVTPNGKKYHKQTCLLIKDHELTELDQAQAKEQDYEPCKKCFKEDQPVEEQE